MDAAISSMSKHFPFFVKKDVITIYHARCERLRLLMTKGMPVNLRLLIEAKVRIDGEFSNEIVPRLAGLDKSTYSKKRRTKRMDVCRKCARWTCSN